MGSWVIASGGRQGRRATGNSYARSAPQRGGRKVGPAQRGIAGVDLLDDDPPDGFDEKRSRLITSVAFIIEGTRMPRCSTGPPIW